MRFDEYHIAPEIKLSLQELAYKKPTDIQFKAIPSILKGEDVLAIAQTGTGKTAAFAIPVVHLINKRKQGRRPDGIRCIVLAPTHELAQQISEVFEQIAKFTEVETLCLTGGVDQDPQIKRLKEGVDILVATPGRLFDLYSQGHIRLERVEVLVLDEADHMLGLGFLQDIDDLVRVLPKTRQTLFFSATIDAGIKKVAYSLVRNAIRIQISPKDPVAKNIDHSVAFIEMDDKRFFLERLITDNPEFKFIAFVRTIVRADRVAAAMHRVGIPCESLHREKDERDRKKIMKRFKADAFKLLVATDISARGIDIPNIDIVVNYDLPEVSEMYVHRVGRTGRGKKKGQAISFCSPKERPVLEQIEAFLQKPVKVIEVGKENYAATLELGEEKSEDWRALMAEVETGEMKGNLGGKKKRKGSGKKKSKKKKGGKSKR